MPLIGETMNLTLVETPEFTRWLKELYIHDDDAALRVFTRLDRAKQGDFGTCGSARHGVSEMQIPYGPGYRVYFAREGKTVYLLLTGGDKSTQDQDVKDAHRLAKEYLKADDKPEVKKPDKKKHH